MTKKELNLKVLEICEAHGAPEELVTALDALTSPKSGGHTDINDYTCFAEDGTTVESILCNVFKMWLPVSHFKEGKAANGFSRYSDEGREDYRGRQKEYKKGKNAIIADLLDGKLSNDDAKVELQKLEDTRALVGEAPEEATTERPCELVEA